MGWNWLDILIILLCVGQVGLVAAIVQIVGRIKKGPVSRFSAAVGRNLAAGRKLMDTGSKAGAASVPHVLRARAAVMRIPGALRPMSFSDAPITYASALKPLAMLRTLQLGRKATTVRKATPAPGIADRWGLLPPAWKKLTPYLGYVGTIAAVVQEVQKQLPEIKRALSERGSA